MPVSNVFGPEIPGGPSGGATGGQIKYKTVTVDLSGSGGSLSNGVYLFTLRSPTGAAIGTVGASLAGVGAASTFTHLTFNMANLIRSLEPGDDVVGMTMSTSQPVTWGREATGVWLNRVNQLGTVTGHLFDFRNAGTTARVFAAELTGATSTYEGGQPTYDPRSFGVICGPATCTTIRSTTAYGNAAFTPADLDDGVRTQCAVPNGTAENDFATNGSYFNFGVNSFVGTDTTTVTQTATGLDFTLGGFTLPVSRIHMLVMGAY